MEKRHKFSIWYVVIGIWVVLLLHNYLSATLSIQTIPYSQFLRMVKDKKVTEVAITSNQIQGRTHLLLEKETIEGGELKTLMEETGVKGKQ